ncbi:hypothetical protein BD289DRAFT_234758 [Coniella lustricola]|uniref:Uncharacterized protein n=1 Tax=Coniella lustricola TaxID=2025994 RepID=A0A2T3A9V9_9PEZI|nr:hypothetical protein BD289DRAFT_234758 [Coniella lustricola]
MGLLGGETNVRSRAFLSLQPLPVSRQLASSSSLWLVSHSSLHFPSLGHDTDCRRLCRLVSKHPAVLCDRPTHCLVPRRLQRTIILPLRPDYLASICDSLPAQRLGRPHHPPWTCTVTYDAPSRSLPGFLDTSQLVTLVTGCHGRLLIQFSPLVLPACPPDLASRSHHTPVPSRS